MTNEDLKSRLYHIIFGTESKAGKLFDVVLIYTILLSVLALMLDSIAVVSSRIGVILFWAEWTFTVLFTVEYLLRIYCAPKPWAYMRSFYGVVDLVSVLPTYLALIVPGASFILVMRLIRVLRIFRVLKLARYLAEADTLVRSLLQARRKIFVFFCVVLVLSTIFGSVMYVVEGPQNGFTSIPKSIYWTIVTITTVGYGDITPQTVMGQIVASLSMLTGYSIIAIPTGIVSAELIHEIQREKATIICRTCDRRGHERDAKFCKFCGTNLHV